MATRHSRNNPRPQILHADNLDAVPWLIHAFSTRQGGFSKPYGGNALNLGFTKHDAHNPVERNRQAFLKELGAKRIGVSSLITLRQIHSDLILHVASSNETNLVGDGLITATPGLMLAIQTADCLPIILVDTKNGAVGVFHAGWRGTLQRIIEKGVGEMRRHFGTSPRDLKAAIGPGIHQCCYEVGQEVRDKFSSQFAYAPELFREVKDSDPVREKYPLLFLTARAPGHGDLPTRLFLDLVKANRGQLIDIGVIPKNIEASSLCTSCRQDLLFSYRAEKGITGRMLAVAGIRV